MMDTTTNIKTKSNEKQPDTSFFTKIIRCVKQLIVGKPKPCVAVIRLEGVIGQASSFKKGLSLHSLRDSIEKSFKLPSVKAVILQINSPGGSPVQSELISSYILQLSKKNNIPVYSFIEDIGASGGYWLACTGEEIYASNLSIVGSIGVIMSGFGFVEAIEKMGIERRVHTQGENKSILDPFKPEKQSDIAIVHAVQKDIHDGFKEYVQTRRNEKLDEAQLATIFSGEFWSGKQAKALGLIDDTKDLHSFVQERYGESTRCVTVQKEKGWLKQRFGMLCSMLTDSLMNSATNSIKQAEYRSRFRID